MKTPLSHLHRNRFGTFYFRITIDGKTVKRSLKTKLPELATMRVAALNWQWSTMKQPKEPNVADIVKALKAEKAPKFDATFPDGSTFKGIKTDDDARRAKELMLARIEAIGPIEQQYRPQQLQQALQTAAAHFKPGNRFSKVTPAYIAEKKVDDQNRTKKHHRLVSQVTDIAGVSARPAKCRSRRRRLDTPQCSLGARHAHACQPRDRAGTNTA
jgi:hypothetical protein